jgi:hypothetical protein
VISVLSELDPRSLDRAAVAVSLAVVAEVSPDQLDLPTPCGDWRLGELIAHLVAENRGFAANATRLPGEVSRDVWRLKPGAASALADYPGSVEAMTAAFAPDAVLLPAERPAGSPFAAVVQVAANASAGDRRLGLAGRDPQWSSR